MSINELLPYILIGLGVILGLGIGLAVIRSRARRALPPAPVREELPPQQDPAAEHASSPAAPETQEAQAPALPSAPPVPDVAPLPAAAGAPVAELDQPASSASRLQRLAARLTRSGALGASLVRLLSRGDLTEQDWEEIEETLLGADLGAGPTEELLTELRQRLAISGGTDTASARKHLRELLVNLLDPTANRELNLQPSLGADGAPRPAVVLVVGVNGTGKTTTVGKLARLLVAENQDVILGAADTFRAAAADQLQTWGERVGVEVVRSEREGADPASVAFDAVKAGTSAGADVVLVDTAGRLQNKQGLMDELGKIRRVIEKEAPISEVLLVLDATTGQNGLRQAQAFAEATGITGIVLTKLDGTAKGGIVVAVQRELGVPVKFIGIGEGVDDLAPFSAEAFAQALVAPA